MGIVLGHLETAAEAYRKENGQPLLIVIDDIQQALRNPKLFDSVEGLLGVLVTLRLKGNARILFCSSDYVQAHRLKSSECKVFFFSFSLKLICIYFFSTF